MDEGTDREMVDGEKPEAVEQPIEGGDEEATPGDEPTDETED